MMDFKEINDHFKQLNKDISGLNKESKKQQKEKFNDSTLSLLKLMSEDMRSHNASDQSIQLALKGAYEFFKVVTKAEECTRHLNTMPRAKKRIEEERKAMELEDEAF
jgi:hypothetical protein